MSRLMIILLLFLPLATPLQADDTSANPVLIIMRHAEKKTGENPCLTDTGKARAARLAALLARQAIAALLSTEFCRTRETLEVIARQRGLTIEPYAPTDTATIRTALTNAGNRAVIVAGHSNTVPALLADFGVAVAAIDETEYDHLYIVTFGNNESIMATGMVHLSY